MFAAQLKALRHSHQALLIPAAPTGAHCQRSGKLCVYIPVAACVDVCVCICVYVLQEGLKSLWRGLDSALLMSVPTVLLYYPMYDLLQSVLANKARDSPTATLAAPVVAGAVARTITVYAVSPLELVRVRQQAGHAPTTTSITAASSGQAAPGSAGSSGRAAGAGAGGMTTLQALRSSLGEGGGSAGSVVNLRAVSRLWTGLSATIARDVPFSAIYW